MSALAIPAPEVGLAPMVAMPSGILGAVRSGDTERLLRAALQRDDSALGALLERLRPRIVLWAATRLSDELKTKTEPDDVAQLVLVSIHRDIAGFESDDEGEFLRWVFAIGENRIRDLARYFRAGKRSPRAASDDLEPGTAKEIDEVLATPAAARRFRQTTPSEAAARSEALERMHQAIAALSPQHRWVLQLRDLETRSYEEVADIMALESKGAARTLRCRALIALRRAMQSEPEDGAGRTAAE